MKAKSLQKLTETQRKINLLMKKKKITKADLDNFLTDREKDIWAKQMTEKLSTLKGEERDRFLEQIEEITAQSTKNQLWEANHMSITRAISAYIEDYGKMPGKNQIAETTGLSRTTIHKHLKDYDSHPLYAEEMRKFRFMADRVLSKMFRKAVEGSGDTKAARLYFEVLGYLGNSQITTIKTQNNYIQINGKVVSQEIVKKLSPEQLLTIENILNSSVAEAR
jgi:DNA-binding phage protein